jgi:hypothetical protein
MLCFSTVYSIMISFFVLRALTISLDGQWIEKYANSFAEEFHFSITFKVAGVRFHGRVRVGQSERFLPNRVHVRELWVSFTFVIFLPFAHQEPFKTIGASPRTDGVLSGTALSKDGSYKVSLAITPKSESIFISRRRTVIRIGIRWIRNAAEH